MKTPYLIKNSQNQPWLHLDGCFIDYPYGNSEAVHDGMGLSPEEKDSELEKAKLVDSHAELFCTDAGPFLPTGFQYFDGRYNKLATVLHSTENYLWVELEGGRKEDLSRSYYEYHLNAGIYFIPKNN